MRRAIPPDHDPELRRVIALDADAQCAELRALFGELPQASVQQPATGEFIPVPMKVRRTERGALSCVPTDFPEDSIVEPDSNHLCVMIEHDLLWRREAPRTPSLVADLESRLAEFGSRRGYHKVPFAPPKSWTVETLRELIPTIVACLPNEAGTMYRAFFDDSWIVKESVVYLDVKPRLTGGFYASVALDSSLIGGAFAEWKIATLCTWGDSSFPVEEVEAVISRCRANMAADRKRSGADGDDDDDDLDAIERAARRALHGDRSIPRATPQAAANNSSHPAFRLTSKLLALIDNDPREAAALELLFDGILRRKGLR